MDNVNDKYLMPFGIGSELTSSSFKLSQCDNTYMLAGSRYKEFYSAYIRPRVAMYRGWIEGFHNTEFGVLPSLFLQKIGTGIVSTLFNKPMVLNSKENSTNNITETNFRKVKFNDKIKEAYGFALDGGTCLIKWNKDGLNQLRLESVPMDKFFIEVDSYGDIEKVKSFIATYHNTINSTQEYYLCEERFFKYSNGKRYPFVHYLFYKTSSSTTYEGTPAPSESITWKDIPYDVRKMLQRDYGNIFIDDYSAETLHKINDDIKYDRCKLLPFDNDLGCRLLKFTRNIPSFPKMPFGQPLADLLMNESYAYDQLKFFEKVEVYSARARILLERMYDNPNDPDARKNALDEFIFTYYDNIAGESHDNKPVVLQPELRAEAINRQKQNILNDTAFALGLSSSTIAAWLSDGTTQKTATEIEYEKTKTSAFINDKLEIIKEELQDMINIYYHYYGVSSPELNIMPENQTIRSEMIRLYADLFEKGYITAKMFATEILGTCSSKEVEELENYIEEKKPQVNVGG